MFNWLFRKKSTKFTNDNSNTENTPSTTEYKSYEDLYKIFSSRYEALKDRPDFEKIIEKKITKYYYYIERYKQDESSPNNTNANNAIENCSQKHKEYSQKMTSVKDMNIMQKSQIELDKYWSKKKTNREIGINYERYVGYIYEEDGYKVKFQGALKGLEDAGRDLIVEKNSEIIIIQCKYWSQDKVIHEKTIHQLFGTVSEFTVEQTIYKVRGLLVTSTSLSERAKQCAQKLNIEYRENFLFKIYPCVKCNISKSTKEKIYHLPFDASYDKVEIEIDKEELYVATIEEAENLGFRRSVN